MKKSLRIVSYCHLHHILMKKRSNDGRINAANLPKESKNQVIVSKSHHLSSLIVKDTHQYNFHIGSEQTLCLL